MEKYIFIIQWLSILIYSIILPLYLNKIKKNMLLISKIIYYIICIFTVISLLTLIIPSLLEMYNLWGKSDAKWFLIAIIPWFCLFMYHILYILFILSLIYKNKGILNFSKDEKTISIIIIIPIIILQIMSKGNFFQYKEIWNFLTSSSLTFTKKK